MKKGLALFFLVASLFAFVAPALASRQFPDGYRVQPVVERVTERCRLCGFEVTGVGKHYPADMDDDHNRVAAIARYNATIDAREKLIAHLRSDCKMRKR